MRRAVAAVATGTVVLGALVLGAAAPAFAHNYLVASTPSAGEVLTELPEHFSVTTNEPLLDLDGSGSGFGIVIQGADGLYYGDGCVTVEGDTVYADPAIGEAGEYTMIWQVVSDDGHTVSDELDFTWKPSGDFEKATGSATQGDCNGLYARGDGASQEAGAASIDLSSVLWIGGAILAVLVAAGVTLLLVRPKKN